MGPCDRYNASCGSGLNCVCGTCLGCSTDTIECVNLATDNNLRLECKRHGHKERYNRIPHPKLMLVNEDNDYFETLTRE